MGPLRPLLTTGQRNRSHVVLAVLSGTLAAAAAAGTGVATAVAARETARERAAGAEATAATSARVAAEHQVAMQKWAHDNPVVVTTTRPVRTVVGPTVVVRASAPGVARVGGSSGGTAPVGAAPSTRRSGSSSLAPAAPSPPRAPTAPAPRPAPPAAPPPPPPPPITTSGS